jgi:hypothetical protein
LPGFVCVNEFNGFYRRRINIRLHLHLGFPTKITWATANLLAKTAAKVEWVFNAYLHSDRLNFVIAGSQQVTGSFDAMTT